MTRSKSQILGTICLAAAIGVLTFGHVPAAEPNSSIAKPESAPAARVREALKSELSGDNARRQDLLRQALDESPGDAAVHWQLGQVRAQGKWQFPAEVEWAARQDKRLAEYAQRRDAAGPNVSDQAELARWCRKNRLDDQQQVHWMTALQLEPDNAEATKALGLRPFGGMMLTPKQIEQFRARLHRVSAAADVWRPRAAQWLAAIEQTSAIMPDGFRDQLCRIIDPCEMIGLERSVWQLAKARNKKQELHRMVLAIMLALADNPSPAAAEALAYSAALSEFNDVCAAAAAGLKGRPLDHFAPLLLSGMQSPIKGKSNVTLGRFSWGVLCTTYQEGALADLSFSYMLYFAPLVEFDDGTIVGAETVNSAAASRGISGVDSILAAGAPGPDAANKFAANFTRTVERTNAAIRRRNVRITAALRSLTGLDMGDEPMAWWKWWWQDYTEMHNMDGEDAPPKPLYGNYAVQTYGPIVHVSCFAPGTKVWTLTGRRPIEKIKIGDRLLAQDVETGELAYKPVLATTVRKPGPRTRVGLGSESIVATPSHPFWVLGQGWRMTKQLEIGNRVHTPSGGVLVEGIEKLKPDPTPAGKTYNLVVADFHSYFVGDHGVLVHDNTPRPATAALLPGLAPRAAP
jgi:hypothetical protein